MRTAKHTMLRSGSAKHNKTLTGKWKWKTIQWVFITKGWAGEIKAWICLSAIFIPQLSRPLEARSSSQKIDRKIYMCHWPSIFWGNLLQLGYRRGKIVGSLPQQVIVFDWQLIVSSTNDSWWCYEQLSRTIQSELNDGKQYYQQLSTNNAVRARWW